MRPDRVVARRDACTYDGHTPPRPNGFRQGGEQDVVRRSGTTCLAIHRCDGSTRRGPTSRRASNMNARQIIRCDLHMKTYEPPKDGRGDWFSNHCPEMPGNSRPPRYRATSVSAAASPATTAVRPQDSTHYAVSNRSKLRGYEHPQPISLTAFAAAPTPSSTMLRSRHRCRGILGAGQPVPLDAGRARQWLPALTRRSCRSNASSAHRTQWSGSSPPQQGRAALLQRAPAGFAPAAEPRKAQRAFRF